MWDGAILNSMVDDKWNLTYHNMDITLALYGFSFTNSWKLHFESLKTIQHANLGVHKM